MITGHLDACIPGLGETFTELPFTILQVIMFGGLYAKASL